MALKKVDLGPDEVSLAELELAIGAPFDPPTTPASRALYIWHIEHCLNPDALPNVFLLGNVPEDVMALQIECEELRAKHTIPELVAMAKSELENV